jgi:hypothetical protein
MTDDQIEAMKILTNGPRFLQNTDKDGHNVYGGHYVWKDEVRHNPNLASRFMQDWCKEQTNG